MYVFLCISICYVNEIFFKSPFFKICAEVGLRVLQDV